LLIKENFLDFASSLVSGELLVSPLVHSISLFSFSSGFLSLSVGLLLSYPCCGLLVASSVATPGGEKVNPRNPKRSLANAPASPQLTKDLKLATREWYYQGAVGFLLTRCKAVELEGTLNHSLVSACFLISCNFVVACCL